MSWVNRDCTIIKDAFVGSIADAVGEQDRSLVCSMAEPWHVSVVSSKWPLVTGAPGGSFACPLEFARRLSEELQQDAREGGLLTYPAFLQAINLWPTSEGQACGSVEQFHATRAIYVSGSKNEQCVTGFYDDARSTSMCRQYARDQAARRLGYPFEWPQGFCGTAWVAVRCLTRGACARRFFVCTLRDLPERLAQLGMIPEAKLGTETDKKTHDWTYLVSCWRQSRVPQKDMREEAEAWLYCDLARDERHRTDFYGRVRIARHPVSPCTPKSFAARHADELMFGHADTIADAGLGAISLRRPCARELRTIRRAYRRQLRGDASQKGDLESLSRFQRSWLARHVDCDTPDNSDHEEDQDDRLGGLGRRTHDNWALRQPNECRRDAMHAHLLNVTWEKYLGKRATEGVAAIMSQTQHACVRDNEALRTLEKVAEKEAKLATSLGMSWELYLSVRDELKSGKSWYALDMRQDVLELGPEWKKHARGIEYAWRHEQISLLEYLNRTQERTVSYVFSEEPQPAAETGCRTTHYGSVGHRDPLDSCNHLSYEE